jgi:hypothetical protein
VDALALIANSGATTCYEGQGIDETCVVSCSPGYSIFGQADRRGEDIPIQCIDDNGVGTISEVVGANGKNKLCEMLPCSEPYTPEASKGFILSNVSTSMDEPGSCAKGEPLGGGNICGFECRNGVNSNGAGYLTCVAGTYYGCTEGSCDVLIAAPICLDDSKTYDEITVVASVTEFSLSTRSLSNMLNKAVEAREALVNGFAAGLNVTPSAVEFTASDPGKIARSTGRRLSDDSALLVLNFEITVDSPNSTATRGLLGKIRKITAQDANATAAFLAAVNAAFQQAGMTVTMDGVMISEPMVTTVFREVITPAPTPIPTPQPTPTPVTPPDEGSGFLWYFLGFLFLVGAGGGGYKVFQAQRNKMKFGPKKTKEERQAERAAQSADDI